jgi:hypothetical protein
LCEITCFSLCEKKSSPSSSCVACQSGNGPCTNKHRHPHLCKLLIVTMDLPISLKFVTEISTSLIWV